jgi:excisionase family DNA binding protein
MRLSSRGCECHFLEREGIFVTQLVKIELVAEKLSVTVENVQQLVRDRQIPVVRLSRKLWRFDPEKVQAAVAKLEIRPR